MLVFIIRDFHWYGKLPPIKNKQYYRESNKGSFLVALTICLIPFNSLPYLQNYLREMSNEGAFYPLALLSIILILGIIQVWKLKVPINLSFSLLTFFYIWIIILSVVNFPEIMYASTKGRSGLEKLSLQLVLFSFCISVAIIIYQSMIRVPFCLAHFRKYVLISFIICGLYSIVEIAYLSGNGRAEAILVGVNKYIFPDIMNLYYGRLRSVSGEASWFAMYCSLVLPWLLSYIFSSHGRTWPYIFLFAYFILMVILTKSRTAYFITTIQLFLFFLIALFVQGKQKKHRRKLLSFLSFLILFLALVTIRYGIGEQGFINIFMSLAAEDNLSNISRFGAQIAGYNMAFDHPIFGVGIGQYGFHVADYMPSWALISPEIQEWISPAPGTAWAPVHSIYARIASETGIVGLLLWIFIWGSILLDCSRRYRSNTITHGQQDYLGLSLIVSIIGILLSGFNADSFRFFGYWILLGLAWAYITPASKHIKAYYAGFNPKPNNFSRVMLVQK